MKYVKQRQTQISEGAREITPNNVMHWSKHYKELEGKFKKKALKFLQYDCIKYVADQNEYKERCSFIVLPLNTKETVTDRHTGRDFNKKPYTTDYNSTIYTITKEKNRFECNCQGWHSKEKKGEGRDDGCQCAHTLALFLAFKCRKFHKKQGV